LANSKNPNAREYYVYRFLSNGRTFYIGKGHWPPGNKWHRVNDRGNYVKWLRTQKQHKDWSKQEIQVLNRLRFDHKMEIRWEFLDRDKTSDEAEQIEKERIREYVLQRGCKLANVRDNPAPCTVDAVVEYVLNGSPEPSRADLWVLGFSGRAQS